MAIKWGSTTVTVVKWGSTTCTKVYWGNTLVFPAEKVIYTSSLKITDYFTISQRHSNSELGSYTNYQINVRAVSNNDGGYAHYFLTSKNTYSPISEGFKSMAFICFIDSDNDSTKQAVDIDMMFDSSTASILYKANLHAPENTSTTPVPDAGKSYSSSIGSFQSTATDPGYVYIDIESALSSTIGTTSNGYLHIKFTEIKFVE